MNYLHLSFYLSCGLLQDHIPLADFGSMASYKMPVKMP